MKENLFYVSTFFQGVKSACFRLQVQGGHEGERIGVQQGLLPLLPVQEGELLLPEDGHGRRVKEGPRAQVEASRGELQWIIVQSMFHLGKSPPQEEIVALIEFVANTNLYQTNEEICQV